MSGKDAKRRRRHWRRVGGGGPDRRRLPVTREFTARMAIRTDLGIVIHSRDRHDVAILWPEHGQEVYLAAAALIEKGGGVAFVKAARRGQDKIDIGDMELADPRHHWNDDWLG